MPVFAELQLKNINYVLKVHKHILKIKLSLVRYKSMLLNFCFVLCFNKLFFSVYRCNSCATFSAYVLVSVCTSLEVFVFLHNYKSLILIIPISNSIYVSQYLVYLFLSFISPLPFFIFIFLMAFFFLQIKH